MDSKINLLKNKINILKYKYPNVVGMWERYINIRTKHLNETLESCLNVLHKLETQETDTDDIPRDVIYFMYLLNNTI